MNRLIIILGFVFMTICPSLADVPKLTAHVNDLTSSLSKGQIQSLEQKLNQIEKTYEKHPQVAFLLVPTIPNDDIEKFANDVFHQNKLGQKDVDNGLLVVIASNQRKMRVEVGYGLEEFIPDSVAKDITESMKPSLRSKNYEGAISTAIFNIQKHLPDISSQGVVKETRVVSKGKVKESGSMIGTIIIALFVAGGLWVFWKIINADEPKTKKPMTPRPTPPRPQTPSSVYPRYTSTPPVTPIKSSGPGFGTGLATGMIVESLLNSSKRKDDEDDYKRRRKSDDSYSSGYTSSWSDNDSSSSSSSSWDSGSSSSDSGSSWSGGGGDSGGGGSSDSW